MIKSTLLAAAMATALVSLSDLSATEIEELRTLCLEQERQIRLLEEENMRLRSLTGQNRTVESTPAPRPGSVEATTPGAATATRENDASTSFYIVKQGDSIARIARQTGSTPATLARLNGLKDPGMIKPGQKLKLPDTAPQAPADTTPTPRGATADGRTHTIRQGDTFFSIARKYGLSMEALVAANPEVKPSAMRLGQTIRLGTASNTPASTARVTPATPAAANPAAATTAATKPPTPATPANPSTGSSQATTGPPPTAKTAAASSTNEPEIRTITTDGQMTYGEFATKHGSSVDRLNTLNALSLDADTILAKGSELYVPAQP